jgi:Uma2 family endonuclease
MRLGVQVSNWNDEHQAGRVGSPSGGFRLPDTSVRAADCAFVSHERWNALTPSERQGFARFVPDVVFELISPSDSLEATQRKCERYLVNGVHLAVLLEPRKRFVELYRPGRAVERFDGMQRLALEPELPGFVLDVAAVFAPYAEEPTPSG